MISKTYLLPLGMVAAVFAFASCRPSASSGRGLALPEGSIESGRVAFAELGCVQCHTVKGIDLPPFQGETTFMLELGGEMLRVKTYGELVTSLINPDHVISSKYLDQLPKAHGALPESPMPDFTQEMTVAQMVDLVALLHSRYILRPRPDYKFYGEYP